MPPSGLPTASTVGPQAPPWADVQQRLHARGLRWTPQRRVVIDVLSRSDGHVTGAELVDRCRMVDPATTPSTVYRTLDVLEELGLVLTLTPQQVADVATRAGIRPVSPMRAKLAASAGVHPSSARS